MAWELAGEYLENCNCDVLCPCVTSSLQGSADNERCFVPLAMNITSGHNDGVRLDGLGAVMVVDSPAVMGSGGWRVAVYLDERADDGQRQALGEILSGALGGPPAMLAGLVSEQLGVKFVPISFDSHEDTRRVTVPGIMDFEVTGIRAPGANAVMRLFHIFHPMGGDLALAQSSIGTFNDPDYGLSFDNAGKNGHYRDFAWAA
ncbi:DUF1326 domain-containing protein [Arthrobacter sp. 35W]|uniref:DUF1326 domain-containing protein n=1 Tax=Arthrobacter sp. 35W TaxID=1132441 RepID=UPI0004786AFC|nr:DUF1326 domain-containing protein [Arthrobacter sp. 35W]